MQPEGRRRKRQRRYGEEDEAGYGRRQVGPEESGPH
jgi:hypothetical protein